MRCITIINRFYALLCSLFCLLLLSGCYPSPETPLRIGSNTWTGYEPLYLSQRLGYYEKSQVKLIEMSSASEVIHALRNGNLEGAALTLDETLTLLDDGFELSLILVMDYSNGADALLAKPEIQSINNLKGKRVAVEYTAVGAILLDASLDSVNLAAEDIEIVSCPIDQHVECYSEVDAVVTFDPAKTKILNAGAHTLFDSRQIPGRIIDVLVVRNEILNTHARTLEVLISGYFQARKYMRSESETAAQLMAVRMELTPAEVFASFNHLHLPTLQENRAFLAPSTSDNIIPIQQTAEDLARLMHQKGFLKNPVPADNFANARFLPTKDSQ